MAVLLVLALTGCGSEKRSAGKEWSRVPRDEKAFGRGEMLSVTAGGPGLVAVGYSNGGAAVWFSRDGRSWPRVRREENVLGGTLGMFSVTAGGPGLVAVGSEDSDAAVWLSPPGSD